MSLTSLRVAALALATLLLGTACQKAGETALSAATGGAVDLKDGKMTITNDKGEKVVVNADGKGEGGKVTITGPKGEQVVMTGDGKGGNLTMTGGENGQQIKVASGDNVAMPAECPVKLADGYKAVSVQGGNDAQGKKLCAVMATGNGKVADVAAFYDSALKGLGYTVTRNDMKMNDMETTVLAGKKGDSAINVSVTSDPKGGSLQIMGEGL